MMMKAEVTDNKEMALKASQEWIDTNGLTDVCKAKNFVMKVPVNKNYQMPQAFMFLTPSDEIKNTLVDRADEITAKKLTKIQALEEEAAALRASMMSAPVVEDLDMSELNDYSRPPHPPIGQPMLGHSKFA
jgi:hypothetical protein